MNTRALKSSAIGASSHHPGLIVTLPTICYRAESRETNNVTRDVNNVKRDANDTIRGRGQISNGR